MDKDKIDTEEIKKIVLFLFQHWRWVLTIVTLLVVAMAIRSLSNAVKGGGDLVSMGIEKDTAIALTPAQVTSIRKIGKWEFLSMRMEEIVDTTHKRMLLSDEELVRIYKGTIRLGVDMSKLSNDWLTSKGDTAVVKLPKIAPLNKKFIDEARTETFYESGSWSGEAREQMYQRAESRMKSRLAKSNAYQEAEQNGREQVTALMRSFGFRTVEVSFGK